jgi:hypothetical protein
VLPPSTNDTPKPEPFNAVAVKAALEAPAADAKKEEVKPTEPAK